MLKDLHFVFIVNLFLDVNLDYIFATGCLSTNIHEKNVYSDKTITVLRSRRTKMIRCFFLVKYVHCIIPHLSFSI